MNSCWKFLKPGTIDAEKSEFNDSKWKTVSTAHTYNDIDTYDEIISCGGEKSEYLGIAKYRNGANPCGLDISDAVKFDGQDNIPAVKIDNSNNYVKEATGASFQWMSKDFNPNYGDTNHNVWLHITGKVYQTLHLYQNLKTTVVYVYAKKHFSLK